MMGTVYRHWVMEARDGLHDPDRRQDAVTALRAMVDEIVLTPQGDELGILLKGDLAAMLAAARKTKSSRNPTTSPCKYRWLRGPQPSIPTDLCIPASLYMVAA